MTTSADGGRAHHVGPRCRVVAAARVKEIVYFNKTKSRGVAAANSIAGKTRRVTAPALPTRAC